MAAAKLLVAILLMPILLSHQQLLEGAIKLLSDIGNQYQKEPRDSIVLLPEYDFIVVGAGTAGCVLANRLTENPNWEVLLLEAGGHEKFLMDLPILANYLQFSPANWKYFTEPSDRYCLGMDNNQCHWPRGKVMGGSSVLNYMLYSRGNHRDYDRWAELGNPGWSYADVLPYFKKIEDFRVPEFFNSTYHGRGGYLAVSNPPFHTKIAEAIVSAGMQMGWKYVDYNGREQIGISFSQASLDDGVRASSSRSYLHPISNRKNLHVKKFAQVTKVLIDADTKEAYGVEFVRFGRKYRTKARKEVILSAGAIGSPQILMLSGIGPRKHLKQLGIPVVRNSKVGYNLMDHIACGGITFLVNETISIFIKRMFTNEILSDYLNDHRGPLSVPGGLEACSFHDTQNPNDPDGWPDLELFYLGGGMSADETLHKNFAMRDEIYYEMYGPIADKDAFMIFPMILRPKSRGRLVLRDADYRSKPMIFPNYLSHKDDVQVMVDGIKLMLELIRQPALEKIGAQLYTNPLPTCKHLDFASDDYWECMGRHFTFTIYHQSGTCKMGPRSDKDAVVDARLRVHGIGKLRVVDASIMPEIVAAHTNAPAFMIGEKGADLVKEDWGYV